MKTLEEEAQEFEDGNYMTATDKDVFIAGANSKWVQVEKIKTLIEENKSVLEMLGTYGSPVSLMRISYRLKNLEQQLKELEQ
jgi:hypothetical protein